MYKRLTDENHSNENSQDESKTETTDLSSATKPGSSYGSTSLQDESVPQCYVPWCGVIFYVMAFFGFVSSTLLRSGLSVAIVAMVNQTAVADEDVVLSSVTRDPELQYEDGEFNWDRNHQGLVLAAFFYGYGLTQIPAGWMADRFGGRWLFGGCILLSSVIALLTPSAARIHIVLMIILRVLSGLGEGVMFPAIYALIARWSVPKYRSFVVSILFIGYSVGTVVGMLLAGVLSDYGFAGGWPSVFYVFGMFGCVWSVGWFLLCYNSPSTHPRISTAERKYWETMIGTTDLVAHPPTPWREILTSIPVWALAIAFFADSWGFTTMETCLPLYMHDVFGIDMTKTGAFSAFSFMTAMVAMPVAGLFADWLRAPGRLSTNLVRKLFCGVGYIATSGFLILEGYISYSPAVAVAIMFAVLTSANVAFTTVSTNQLDLAPLHAGKIMGLTSAIMNLASIAGPHVVGVLTSHHSTRSEWQNVFLLAAGVFAVSAIIYVIFGSGNRQSWADDPSSVEPSATLDPKKQHMNDDKVTDFPEH